MAVEGRRWVLRHVTRALPCKHFEIKLVTQPSDGTHGRCIKTMMMSPDELISEWKQFGRRSAQGLNVFMRPVGGPVHVLLDLDTAGTLDEVLSLMAYDGIVPSLVVETSPARAQVWCSLPGREQPVEVHRATSKLLAERYCGDPGSAKPSQPGRLPGTMNPKPSRAMTDGAPPLVMIRSSGESHGTKLPSCFRPSNRLLAEALLRAERHTQEGDEAAPVHVDALAEHADDIAEVAEMLADAVERHGGDRSRADFEMACVMLRSGDRPEHVAAMLMETSEKAQERATRQTDAGVRYVERTVRRAMQAVCGSGRVKAGKR
ncbi:DNA-primase RepB domain-containing protein [Ruegeria sp. HKCCD6428]|uniref:DNA-primase RepB domain-containing protein n=1 Tax=Ruegeria sp. HKCCD6428 TaxID=2683002 RepID=UPI0014918570|nr:DNA-primase RepB domain-containing protein [Ruegeria sp. HKCCD6428]NOC83337.1 hypothetical protein [Ruegeria sp. HKCCD6428]